MNEYGLLRRFSQRCHQACKAYGEAITGYCSNDYINCRIGNLFIHSRLIDSYMTVYTTERPANRLVYAEAYGKCTARDIGLVIAAQKTLDRHLLLEDLAGI